MKHALHFFWRYKAFSFALLAATIGGVLTLFGQDEAARWLLAISALASVFPLGKGMWEDFRHGQYGLDILALTAIVSAVLLREYWAAIIVVLMLTGGESLEDYAERRAQSELEALMKRKPQTAHLLRGGKVTDVRASSVNGGDKLIIKPGEIVPVDAIILDGVADFDESSLTGESLPQSKKKDEQILSGSVNLDGVITVKAIHSAADSQYEQIIKLVKAASGNPAPFVRLTDRFSIPFTIVAFAIAGTVWAISGDSMRFLQVIIVATPCPLLLAAPIALISGMSRASKYGIVIKTGSALEKLANVRTIAFDKTGTLTRGEPVVKNILTFNGFTQADVLGAAAALEQNSNHVLGKAVVAAATARKIIVAKAKHVTEVAGHGLKAQLKSKKVLVGRLEFMQDNGIQLPAAFKATSIASTAACVAIDGELAGVISFVDELRPETKSTLDQLQLAGVTKMLMITGDNDAAARSIAKSLGIKDYTANALPADKLSAVEHLKDRPVAFVGDGVNDAPVLTASDVGIALGARGSTAASESADVVILNDDLTHVARAIITAKRTFKIARQSIVIGIAISVGLMGLFATGKFSPVLGALLQEVVDVVVIFNALRAHNIKVLEN